MNSTSSIFQCRLSSAIGAERGAVEGTFTKRVKRIVEVFIDNRSVGRLNRNGSEKANEEDNW
ncbi:hypothetical protein HC891_04330 [Candidatus Gracilibacteria bacterium]|nr:hypothetical protein [Candidatus Gracilibacteria bacterium]